MSCLTTSATRRSRIVSAVVLTASAAASSHDVLLVPMTSITLYTLMSCSSQPRRPHEGDDARADTIDPSTGRKVIRHERAHLPPGGRSSLASSYGLAAAAMR